MSSSVQQQEEQQQEHHEEQEEQEVQRWVPTHVQVTVLRGRGLRVKGRQGTSDVYTIIQVGREKYSTGVAERTTTPEWQEECSFELQPGALLQGEDLVLTVMHRAAIGLDVFLGQAVIPLEKAFQDNVSAKNQAEWVNLRSRWFRLNSKTGKKEKERGEVQATVQFTRNNLTASMYHLAMKERGHSAFSKLKERMRGKKRCAADEGAPGHPTSASVTTGGLTAGTGASRNRLPSDGGGEEEYEDDEGGEGRRNKMRTFFLRGKLRKSSETRSSSSLGSESSESSSRGGSLSPTAGISVVVSDLSNSPSNSSNLTADNSPDHTADISPKLSPDHSDFGSECHEITIAVPSIYRNGVHHACDTPPLRPSPGEPVVAPAPAKVSPLGLGLLLKPLPTSLSLQNLSPRDEPLPRGGLGGGGSGGPGAGGAGDGRRWSFDTPGEDEKAAIAAALEKSGPMVADEEEQEQQEEEEEEEPSGESAPSAATGAARESYDRKRQQQQKKKKKNKKDSEPGQEKIHKGWFGSKETHAKPSPVVSSKLGPIPESHQPPPPPLLPRSTHPSWGPRARPVPPSSPPPSLGSPLHHTNPFCHSQSSPPPPSPMSPCNPFFSSLQHNPFYGEALSDQPLTPPPLPCLSSSRPPIAHLFPQKPDSNLNNLPRERPTSKDHGVTTSDGTGGGEALAKLKLRPLPPPPADQEEKPSSRKCPNLFTSSMGTSQLDVDGDDPFEAFASCRLQSAAELQPETQKQPEWDFPKGPLLELWDTDKQEPLETTNVTIDSEENKASHPQTWDICLDIFTEHSSHGFAQLIAAIPAATNRQAGVLLTASLDPPVNDGGCTDTNLANCSSNTDCLTSTAPPLALCPDCQCTHSPSLPCEIDKLKDYIDSSNPSSSGVGSLAEEDVLSSISSCSLSEKLPASSANDVVETKSIEGCTLNHCEESPEPTVVSVLKDSEDKLIDWSSPLIINHNVEGNVIQVSNQNEKPQTVISMDEDQCLVPLPMISLVELQCGDGPSKEPISPHVPWSDPSSNNPNTSISSDLELEPIQYDKTEKTEGACELQESLGGLHELQNSSALAASDNNATVTPDIPDIEGTSICPSFHTLTSFLGDESPLLEIPIGTGSLDKQLVRQSSPKPSQLLDLNNLLAMSTPIQVVNESFLMETPLAVGSSDKQVVRQSSPNPSDPVQDLDGTPSIEKWLTPSSLNASTDSQHYQTCLTHNSPMETTVSVDSLVEHPSENLCSSVLTLCGAESCEDFSQVLSPENVSAMELEMSMGVRETGVETILSEEMCLSEESASRLEPVFNVEDFGFYSDTLTNSDMSCNHDNNDKISGGTQEIGEEPPSDDTLPACSLARCPALQRSHSEGSLTTGLAERPLTACGSSPCVAPSLDPHDPSGHSPYSARTRTPLLFLSPTSCLPAEPSAPSARCALPSTPVAALLLSSTPPPPGPAPWALPSAPPSAACIAAPALEEVRATDAGHAVDEPHAVLPPEVEEEEEPQQNSPHPVRPLTPEEKRAPEGRSVLEKLRSTIHPGRSGHLSEAEPERRKSTTEGAGSYYHLTHNELVALLVRREAELEAQRVEFERQTTQLSRREVELRRLKPQVRDLENYIDTLLVRIMEQTPTLLQVRSKFK